MQLGPNYLTAATSAYFGDNGRTFLSTSTGLYLSDEGESWRKVNEEFNGFYFNDVRFATGNGGRLYAWNKNHLWYTTDNGETWTSWFIFFEPAPFAAVNSMVVQGDTVIQALHGGLGYAVNDYGLAQPYPYLNGKNITRVAVNGNSFLAIASDGKTYLSTDRGTSWQINTDFPFTPGEFELGRFDSKGAVLTVADNSTIWLSTDFGKTWTTKMNGLSTNANFYLGDVRIDGDEVFAIAHPTVYKSSLTDSAPWEPLFTVSNQSSPRYISIQGPKMMLTGNQTLIKSVDRGISWSAESITGIHDCRFEYLHAGNADSSIIAYGGSGMFKKKTSDSQFSSFLPIYNQVLIEGNLIYSGGAVVTTRSAIDGSTLSTSPIIPNTLIFSSGDEVAHIQDVFFSLLPTEGIWKLSQNIWLNFNNGLIPNTVSNLKSNESYVFTLVNNRELYRSPVSAPNWTKMEIAPDFSVTQYLVNGTTVLAGGVDSNCYLSTDSGNSWQRIGESALAGGVSALYLDSEYLLAAGYQSKYLFASSDLGASWTHVRMLDSVNYLLSVQSMTIANDSVYLGTNGNGIISLAKSLLARTKQTITFNPLEDKTVGDSPITLTATASSALPVIYSTASEGITINENQITFVKPGTATVTAEQPGNAAFAEADPVSRTFCVNPSKPTVTISDSDSEAVLLVSSASAGNQWYKNGTAIAGATAAQISVTEIGTYTVRVTVDNCSSEASSEQAIVVTGDVWPDHSPDNLIYPNPASQQVTVSLLAFDPAREVEIVVYDGVGVPMTRVVESGRESTTISVYDFPTGLYIVKAQQSHLRQMAKFLRD